MAARILNGRALADKITILLASKVKEAKEKTGFVPGLAYLAIEGDPASGYYAAGIEKACSRVGIFFLLERFPRDIPGGDFLERIRSLNNRREIHGILIQSPLPSHIETNRVMQTVSVEKDVDGIHPFNRGLLFSNHDAFAPCTPKGVVKLLKENEIPLEGKHCVILGRSVIVGRPLALLLLQENATVTIAHRKTENLETITKQADVLIAAVGSPRFVKRSHVSPGAVVVDVGIHEAEGGIVGDVDYPEVAAIASWITPVPGGVGPMTVAVLVLQTFQAFEKIENLNPHSIEADTK